MKFAVDTKYLIDCFDELVHVPSPVSYGVHINPVLEKYAAQFGCELTYDRRGTSYIALEGEDNSKTVLLSAHWDTLGMIVRRIDADGKIRVRSLGGMQYHSAEGLPLPCIPATDGHIPACWPVRRTPAMCLKTAARWSAAKKR